MKPNWGIYIHLPFCQSKCYYCDFYSHRSTEAERARYERAILLHVERVFGQSYGRKSPSPSTLFLGGGTPSLMDPSFLDRLMKLLRSYFQLPLDFEVTVEANPGTLTEESLYGWVKAGCNRLSLGLQAFQPRLLRYLGRPHSSEEIVKAVESAREKGLDNFSFDLIYGIPGQNPEDWLSTLEKVLELHPKHLSLYNLKIEEGTMFSRWQEKGLLEVVSEEIEVLMYEKAVTILEKKGFRQYELSNFALPGYECRHNMNYWQRGDYLGFGSGAVSMEGLRRWTWLQDSKRYVEAIEKGQPIPMEEEIVTALEGAEEALFLGLRRREGVDLTLLEHDFNLSTEVVQQWKKISSQLHQQGWIAYEQEKIALLPKSYLLSNEIMKRYLV
ncbi:radical SAM family heme chaperone HemW [Heliorestis convoluta]|uniref:Heme chaperone HemW n=1 Tax=Heliorestis convoluta TaxID=356322 RepID=A0A5Q2N250_9FIRM|nr:radical SAM family heme chaperone HemW [Heliorestis convoluta]QGG47909.1 Oxygen-independent coproporphyrinogen III oxidase, putative [Heliorestis convoluta]